MPDRFLQRFLRFFFRLLYHQFAWAYDLVAAVVSAGMWRDWGRTALPELRGTRVLEIGHGPGHLLLELAGRGYRAAGIDPSPQMGRLARRRLAREGRAHPGGSPPPLVRGSSLRLPFRSGAFESLVATFPAENFHAAATWQEARRVLTPGGRFVVVLGANIAAASWRHRLAAWLHRVTGQSPLEAARLAMLARVREFIAAQGFAVKILPVPVRASTVMLIVAEKPE